MVRLLLWTRVNLSWQMATLCNRHSSCCERLSISASAETSLTSFARSRYSRALLLSLNAQNTALAPDVCRRLRSLGIYDRNQACILWKRKKRPYRARCRLQGKTRHHQAETSADLIYRLNLLLFPDLWRPPAYESSAQCVFGPACWQRWSAGHLSW